MTVTTTPAPKTIEKTVAGKTITMTPEQAEAFGRELDALKERVIADLGERDATYIRRIIKAQSGPRGRRARAAVRRHLPAVLAGGHGDAGPVARSSTTWRSATT